MLVWYVSLSSFSVSINFSCLAFVFTAFIYTRLWCSLIKLSLSLSLSLSSSAAAASSVSCLYWPECPLREWLPSSQARLPLTRGMTSSRSRCGFHADWRYLSALWSDTWSCGHRTPCPASRGLRLCRARHPPGSAGVGVVSKTIIGTHGRSTIPVVTLQQAIGNKQAV